MSQLHRLYSITVRAIALGMAALAMIVLTSAPAVAQTVTPTNPQGWASNDVRNAGQVGITGDQPYGPGNTGSLEFTLTGSSDKAGYVNTFIPTPQSLSDLSTAGFDWFRSSSSTAPDHFTPVMSLYVAWTGGFGMLQWEGVYNGISVASEDSWQHADFAGGNLWFWQTGGGGPTSTNCKGLNHAGNSGAQLFASLDTWSTGCLADAQVYGVGASVGSGWNGTFNGFADNVQLAFDAGFEMNADFELDRVPGETVPEPATMTLLATGLAGMAAARKRRKQATTK